MRRAGVDVGGTFTDVVVIDDDGAINDFKIPSDPQQLEVGIASGLVRAVRGVDQVDTLGFIGHGTTVATNVTLERNGPRVALISTRGFRDVLEIGRLAKPGDKLYTLKNVMPEPIVLRRDCFEVTERIDARGNVVTALDEREIEEIARTLSDRGIKALAVCLLFSFRNSTHERRIRELVEKIDDTIQVSISSEVWPEFREFERASTTTLNCYLRPAAWHYLDRLRSLIADTFPSSHLWVMQSNGGLTTPEAASGYPVRLVMSGPAGGVVGARYIAQQTGLSNLITVDMGGTSFDVSLIQDTEPGLVDKQEVMGMPVKGRSLDILTIGAGGGSIAWQERDQFRVGPRSSGAFPGPACYGRGGTEPTVTDANLALGLFDAGVPIAGGDLILDHNLAYRACESLGKKLGLSATETAWGIRRIVNAAMGGAVRSASVKRGLDPRDFGLLGFGGAGPLHAADIARELGMADVVIPNVAGCFSALGIAITDAAYDLVHTESAVIDESTSVQVADQFAELVRRGGAELANNGIDAGLHDFVTSVDLRYAGQNSALNLPISSDSNLKATVQAFHLEHERQFGYGAHDGDVEVVNLRVRALGRIGQTDVVSNDAPDRYDARPGGVRQIAVGGNEMAEAGVYDRTTLSPGASFFGPAIVNSSDTTVVVPPRSSATVDSTGNLRITMETA
jgi:N-methylhydantoinase A